MKHIVIWSDVQAPLHDKKVVDKFISFLGDYQPYKLGQVGDFTDSTQAGRWVEGMAGQFDGNLQRDFDISMDILRRTRNVYDGPFVMSRSNHDDRLRLKLERVASEYTSLRDMTIERQLRLDEFEVDFIHEVVDIAPGWVMCHGDEGSLSQIPGRTAFSLSQEYGKSVVCGHTHRLGMVPKTQGYNGKIVRTIYGMEVGHMMDRKKATYLKGGKANWQQGFGILHVSGNNRVYPEIIPVVEGNFTVDGVTY